MMPSGKGCSALFFGHEEPENEVWDKARKAAREKKEKPDGADNDDVYTKIIGHSGSDAGNFFVFFGAN